MTLLIKFSVPACNRLLQRLAKSNVLTHSASIVSVNNPRYEDVKPRVNPWPYETRPFLMRHIPIDGAHKRFNKNSKLIIVEGNVGIDKETFAKKLAEEFDMKVFRAVTIEDVLVRDSGLDLREFNSLLPETLKWCGFDKLYSAKDPRDVRAFLKTQLRLFDWKFNQYKLAASHILNTGQGVVLIGSVFNDRCFAKSLRKVKALSRAGYRYYEKGIHTGLYYLIKPHLVVYLDAPVSYCREQIIKRGRPYEQNSTVLTDEFLESMENLYSKEMLPSLEPTTEILNIDVPNMPDWELIVEDLEEMQLDGPVYGRRMKFLEWEPEWDFTLNLIRVLHSSKFVQFWQKKMYRGYAFDIPELYMGSDDLDALKVITEHPGMRYPRTYDHATGAY